MELQIQNLVSSIRKEGIEAANKEAESIIAEAKKKADSIVADGKAEAQQYKDGAEKEISILRESALVSAEQAKRDAVLSFKAEIQAEFEKILAADIRKLFDILILMHDETVEIDPRSRDPVVVTALRQFATERVDNRTACVFDRASKERTGAVRTGSLKMIPVKHARKTENIRRKRAVLLRKSVKVEIVADHPAESSGRRVNHDRAGSGRDSPLQFTRSRIRLRVIARKRSVWSDKHLRIENFILDPEFHRPGNRAAVAKSEIAVHGEQFAGFVKTLRLRHRLTETRHAFAGNNKVDSGSVKPFFSLAELTERFVASLVATLADIEMNRGNVNDFRHVQASGGSAAISSSLSSVCSRISSVFAGMRIRS